MQWYAILLSSTNRPAEAIAMGRRASALDAQAAGPMLSLGLALRLDGRFDEALDVLRKLTTIHPMSGLSWYYHWVAAWEAGRSEEAIEVLIGWQKATGVDPVSGAELRQALAAGGRPALARLLVAKLPGGFLPFLYATLGEGDLAIRELERMYAEHDTQLGAKDLDRDRAAMAEVVRAVDRGHPAGAEGAGDAVPLG